MDLMTCVSYGSFMRHRECQLLLNNLSIYSRVSSIELLKIGLQSMGSNPEGIGPGYQNSKPNASIIIGNLFELQFKQSQIVP